MVTCRHRIGVLASALLLTSATYAFSHHSIGAYYDITKELMLTGAVTSIEWTNPHTFVHIDVTDAHGAVTNWVIETDSPNSLTRSGWTRTTLHVGDVVTAIGYPSKNGVMGLRLVILRLADGRKLKG
jgi:Family of unknown function (DUF6152)